METWWRCLCGCGLCLFITWPILIKGCVLKINGRLFLHLGRSLRFFISLFSPSVPCPFLLQQTCFQGLNRKWCSSLHGSIPGKRPPPSSAKVSVCTKVADPVASDFLLMRVFGVEPSGSERGLSSREKFFHSENISRISHLIPSYLSSLRPQE